MTQPANRRSAWALCAVALFTSSWADPPGVPPAPPQALFPDLFAAVQTARVFSDSKEFADAVANAPPAQIVAQYRAQRPQSVAALRDFVGTYFDLPTMAEVPDAGLGGASDQATLVQHIDGLWNALTRATVSAPPYSSLLALPHPYVVPGGRFREIYYWDSYFTMLGLVESGRQDLVQDMVLDFAYMIDTFGHVPNGARTYYLSRSQPPVFFAMVGLLSPDDPSRAYAQYLPQLRAEYAYWMEGAQDLRRERAHRRVVALPDGAVLNRYWDDADTPRDESYREDVELARGSGRPARQLYREIRAGAESGWDFSSRWFADGRTLATIDTTEIIPVDLNGLLYGLENAIRLGCRRSGDEVCAKDFARRADARRHAVDRYLWNRRSGAYLDYRWTRGVRVPRLSAATLYPLFTGLASKQQAAAVAKTVAAHLLETGGIATTQQDTGQQWDAPNGWAPLQWVAVSGLRGYGELHLAEEVACRWIATVGGAYRRSGKLLEKYDVSGTGRAGVAWRRRRISPAGWLRLDQRRDAQAVGALPRLRPLRLVDDTSYRRGWERSDSVRLAASDALLRCAATSTPGLRMAAFH